VNKEERAAKAYWDGVAAKYARETRISTDAFHLGPLLPSAGRLGLLPRRLKGRRCLEIGCGGAQNSVFLAKRGAHCTAVDIAAAQVRQARALARRERVALTLRCCPMDRIRTLGLGRFSFVHSVFALPFSTDPESLLAAAADLLRPRGTLLLSTAHPLFQGEWLELDREGPGLFLPEYFRPPVEARRGPAGFVRYRAWPISTVTEWLRAAGLRLDRILEPAPLPLHAMRPAQIRRRVPYDGVAWRELYEKIARVPIALVVLARRAS